MFKLTKEESKKKYKKLKKKNKKLKKKFSKYYQELCEVDSEYRELIEKLKINGLKNIIIIMMEESKLIS